MAKNFLVGLGLVKDDGTEDVPVVSGKGISPKGPYKPSTAAPTVPMVKPEDVVDIQSVYRSVGMDDLTKSIFKAVEMKATLSAANENMPESAIKASVIGLLPTAGLDKDALVADGKARVTALRDAKSISKGETDEKVGQAKDKIADLNRQIEELKTSISTWTKDQETLDHAFDTEIGKIEGAIVFLS